MSWKASLSSLSLLLLLLLLCTVHGAVWKCGLTTLLQCRVCHWADSLTILMVIGVANLHSLLIGLICPILVLY